jgi:hypothetical protein
MGVIGDARVTMAGQTSDLQIEALSLFGSAVERQRH